MICGHTATRWRTTTPVSADLKLKTSKCLFGFSTVKYLGLVSSNRIQPNPDKVKAVKAFLVPTS